MEAKIREAEKVCLLATLDTKFKEADFLRREIEKLGHGVLMMDTGIKSREQSADFPSSAVAKGFEEEILQSKTREEASHYMSIGAGKLLKELYGRGEISAAVSLGGSGGCGLASAAMRALPLGVPKVIVTTMASGNTLPYVMGEDILLINPVVDIQNLNFMTEHALRRAAHILDAMMKTPLRPSGRKTVAITGFGVTTPCVDRCTKLLEDEGYEVLIFHAQGISGGKIM